MTLRRHCPLLVVALLALVALFALWYSDSSPSSSSYEAISPSPPPRVTLQECDAQYGPLFSRIGIDFAPFAERPPWNWENATSLSFCHISCLAFRIENGQLRVLLDRKGWQSRHSNTLAMLRETLRRFPGVIPDLEAVLYSGDNPPSALGFPLLVYTKRPADKGILVPDFTFEVWSEVLIKEWGAQLREIREAAEAAPAFENRSPKVFWRGNNVHPERKLLVALSRANPARVDAKFVFFRKATKNMDEYTPLTENCLSRYLAHTEGHSYSSRLKYILACDSLVVMHPPAYIEFWHHLLQDKKHWLVVPGSFQNLVPTLDAVPLSKQKEIAQAGSQLVLQSLTVDAVHCYFAKVLINLASLYPLAKGTT